MSDYVIRRTLHFLCYGLRMGRDLPSSTIDLLPVTWWFYDSTLTIFHSNCIQRSHSNNSICRFHTKFLFDLSSPLLLLLMHRLEGGGYCIHRYFNNSFISNPSFLFFLLYDPGPQSYPRRRLNWPLLFNKLLIMLQYSTNFKSNLPSLEIKYFWHTPYVNLITHSYKHSYFFCLRNYSK